LNLYLGWDIGTTTKKDEGYGLKWKRMFKIQDLPFYFIFPYPQVTDGQVIRSHGGPSPLIVSDMRLICLVDPFVLFAIWTLQWCICKHFLVFFLLRFHKLCASRELLVNLDGFVIVFEQVSLYYLWNSVKIFIGIDSLTISYICCFY
jgi:hypothetical protein